MRTVALTSYLPIDDPQSLTDVELPKSSLSNDHDLLASQGRVGLAVEPSGTLKIGDPCKAGCIGAHREMMPTRARFKTPDMDEQGRILDRVAALIDAGELKGSQCKARSPINVANLREAHRRLESGSTIGTLAISRVVTVASQPHTCPPLARRFE